MKGQKCACSLPSYIDPELGTKVAHAPRGYSRRQIIIDALWPRITEWHGRSASVVINLLSKEDVPELFELVRHEQVLREYCDKAMWVSRYGKLPRPENPIMAKAMA